MVKLGLQSVEVLEQLLDLVVHILVLFAQFVFPATVVVMQLANGFYVLVAPMNVDVEVVGEGVGVSKAAPEGVLFFGGRDDVDFAAIRKVKLSQ